MNLILKWGIFMNKLDDFYNTIDEKTYRNIKEVSYLTGLTLFNLELYTMNSIPQIFSLLFGISSSLLIGTGMYMGKYGRGGILKTKTGKELEELYQEFLKNYCQFNNFFELDNPIQIQTMFNYLLEEGYLSQHKTFKFENSDELFYWLEGTRVIEGQAVCRHISSMFKDILQILGFSAYQLPVHISEAEKRILLLQQKLNLEEFKEFLLYRLNQIKISPEEHQELLQYINSSNIQLGESNEVLFYHGNEKSLKLSKSNHVITSVFTSGKDYFLDPTQCRIYHRKNIKILYDKEVDCKIFEIPARLCCSGKEEYNALKERLHHPQEQLSRTEEESLIMKTKMLCQENTDIFEQFYNKNCELYNEINKKILKLKKSL